jgi:hypothetical protein
MAYRPSPIEFPDTLAAVPPAERTRAIAHTGIVLLIVTVAALFVSLAYARENVLEHRLPGLWKPGIGVACALLVGALSVSDILRTATFVRRGEWLAIYQRGLRTLTIPISAIVIVKPSTLRTVKLGYASVMCLLIGGIGLPLYLRSSDPRLVYVAWLLVALMAGFAVGLDVVLGRIASTTVEIEGISYTLRRLP